MAEISYTKTNWVNNVTKLNADNMNHIENGIEAIDIALGTKADKSYVDNAIASSAVSPTVETETITGGTKVTITDKDGAHEFNVMNGTNGTNGKDGKNGTNGTDGITPTIGANGNWYLGNTDTGKPSRGANGTNGTDGATWYEGADYPIGAKSNDLWLYTGSTAHTDGFKLGDVSQYNGTGWDVIANIRGATGATGAAGKSAYASAQDGGYTGTEAQFNKGLSVMGQVDGVEDTDALGIDTTVTQNSGNLITSGAVYTFAKAASSQVTPLFAQSVDELNASGDTTKLYVLPDGYIYAYINGVWTNTQLAFTSFDMLNKLKDACVDEVSVEAMNYNLLKPSGCLYQKRLNTGTADIINSNTVNIVSNKFPVESGKHYTISREVDGSRVTYGSSTAGSMIGRVLVYLKDGSTVGAFPVSEMTASNPYAVYDSRASESTFKIVSNDAEFIQIQITFNIDISTPDKLRAQKVMVTSAGTVEESVSKAKESEYLDGDAVPAPEIEYRLKHDDTKANQSALDALSEEVSQVKKDAQNIKVSPRYDDTFIPNERFLRGISNLRDTATSKEFTITITNNSGATIKNAAIAVGLHNTVGIIPTNNNAPFQIYDDVFSSQTGFKFFADGKELPYYIESESDCNYIIDTNVKTDQKTLAVFPNGKIAVWNNAAQKMQISSDDGATWTNICDNISSYPYRILLPDSQNNLFVASHDGKYLYKYTASDGYKTGTTVIDMSTLDTKVGSILAEDSLGNLYLGTYQNSPWHCVIRKSTDHGDTWSIVFDTTECQHVHNIYVNKKVTPNEIFIGLDSNAGSVRTYVSTDYGATWTNISDTIPYNNKDYAFRYAGENFYIGCGERNILGGATLYKTSDYTDQNAYYTLFDNGQGIRDVTNVIDGSDSVLIAGGCVGAPVSTEQLFLSEDKGETWKTVFMRVYPINDIPAGAGLRTFSRKGNQIISQTYTGYAMRFAYGNGAKTIVAIVSVGDIPTTGKNITLKTGYVASIEKMDSVLTAYENIDGKVADIVIGDGYVVDNVSNKRVMSDATEKVDVSTRLGQTSEYKILSDHAFRLNGSANLGKLSRLNFNKGFTVSILFRKEDGKNYLSDEKYHVIFRSGSIRFGLHRRSIFLADGATSIFGDKLYLSDAYLASVDDHYVRVTAWFGTETLPTANTYTSNKRLTNAVTCDTYPIIDNISANDFIVGNDSTEPLYADIPNIARIEIYNRVLSHGEIMSLTNGCNLVTDGSMFN